MRTGAQVQVLSDDRAWGQTAQSRITGDDQGTLDIHAYLTFQLGILAQHERATLYRWRATFVTERIKPIIAPQATTLLDWHRQRGDTLVIITATNRFVTEPIAQLLEVPHLLATDLEEHQGRLTGRPAGIPCFREGKVQRLTQWMQETRTTLADSWFYSDSHNDLPLLEQVVRPVAVDPDAKLRQIALERDWEILSLRQPTLPARVPVR